MFLFQLNKRFYLKILAETANPLLINLLIIPFKFIACTIFDGLFEFRPMENVLFVTYILCLPLPDMFISIPVVRVRKRKHSKNFNTAVGK